MYLHIVPVEPKSLEHDLKKLQGFFGNGGSEEVVRG